MLKRVLFCLFILFLITNSAERGYGDWLVDYPGFPDMKDRRILLLTNTCRMDPIGYRDEYLGNYNILLSQNYPAVDPLYWQIDLNRVARVHSEDQAQNGMSHSSSDGTSFSDRVKSYYTKSGWIAENIAAGNNNAEATIWQWLMDLVDYQNQIPAEDNSGDDGHRKNIMSSNYKEMGAGYAYGPAKYNHFWTQDFGGGTPSYNNPISSAAHFIEGNESIFMATYKDPAGNVPQKAVLNIEGDEYSASIFLGNSDKGTYKVSLPKADSCRNYFFEFTDSEGSSWRHPEGGKLVTIGEGSCNDQYVSPEDLSQIFQYKMKGLRSSIYVFKKEDGSLSIKINDIHTGKLNIALYNVNGRKVLTKNNNHSSKGDFLFDLGNISLGFYILKIKQHSNVILSKGILFK